MTKELAPRFQRSVTAFLLLAACLSCSSRSCSEEPDVAEPPPVVIDGIPVHLKGVLPPANDNNLWHSRNDNSDTVFVFVHGIFSDSQGCWWYVDKADRTRDRFWPELVKADTQFDNPAIFLGGFYTALDSGTYGVSDCAKELWNGLSVPTPDAKDITVLDKPNIIFIGHSTGGIVIRHMLDEHYEAFKDKNVGLVLIASPSLGSDWADWLSWLGEFYNSTLGKQLQWTNTSLEELDDRFKDLIDERKIPHLVGAEAYENRFVLHVDKAPPLATKVVEKISAGRYFGSPTQLRNTDHFSSVKPPDEKHPAHRFLLGFYKNKFKRMVADRPAPPKEPEPVVTSGSFLASLLITLNGSWPPPGFLIVTSAQQSHATAASFTLPQVPPPDVAIPFSQPGQYDFVYSKWNISRPTGAVDSDADVNVSPTVYRKTIPLASSADPVPVPYTELDKVPDLGPGVRNRLDPLPSREGANHE